MPVINLETLVRRDDVNVIRLNTDAPPDLPASLFVVMHTAPESPALLADILGHFGRLPATSATDGERIRPGTIYVAPPDRHLLIEPNRVRVTRGPKWIDCGAEAILFR